MSRRGRDTALPFSRQKRSHVPVVGRGKKSPRSDPGSELRVGGASRRVRKVLYPSHNKTEQARRSGEVGEEPIGVWLGNLLVVGWVG